MSETLGLVKSAVMPILCYTPDETSLTRRASAIHDTIAHHILCSIDNLNDMGDDRGYALIISLYENENQKECTGVPLFFRDQISLGQIYNNIFRTLKKIVSTKGYKLGNRPLVQYWIDRPKKEIINKVLGTGGDDLKYVANKNIICRRWEFTVSSAKTKDESCGIDNLKLGIRQSQPRSEVLSIEKEVRRLRTLRIRYVALQKTLEGREKYVNKIDALNAEIKELRKTSKDINECDEYWKMLKTKIKIMNHKIRANLKLPAGALSLKDVTKVAKFFGVGVTIYDDEGDVAIKYDVNTDTALKKELKSIISTRKAGMVELLLYDNHYWYIKQKGAVNSRIEICDACQNKVDVHDHNCKHKTMDVKDFSKVQCENALENENEGLKNEDEDTKTTVEKMIKHILDFDGHLILPGSGGTGKSYLIKLFKDEWEKKFPFRLVEITSTTGLSAANLNMDGVTTIHRFTGLGRKLNSPRVNFESIIKKFDDVQKIKLYNCDVLVIDEAGRLGANSMDNINELLQRIKKNNKPFGGVHIILAADYLQTQPIDDEYHFMSEVWKKIFPTLLPINTPKGYRFSTREWFNLLEKVRFGQVNKAEHTELVTRVFTEQQLDRHFELTVNKPLRVFATRKEVKEYNDKCSSLIIGDVVTFRARDKKRNSSGLYFEEEADDEKEKDIDYRIPPKLKLKVGSRVMLRTNKFQHKMPLLCSGSIGNVISMDQKTPSITIKFDLIDEEFVLEEQSIDYRTGFPLILAHGATIDICQGLSLDQIIVDIRRLNFGIAGKVYTAFSRSRSMEGLFIVKDPNGNNGLSFRKIAINKNAIMMLDILSNHTMEVKQNMNEVEFEESTAVFTADDADVINIKVKRSQISNDKDEDSEELRKKLLKDKLIVFDYETFRDSKTERLHPYYCYVKVFKHGKLADTQIFRGSETSLKTFEYVFSLLENNKARLTPLKRSKDPKKMSAREWLRKPYTIAAYNGSNFDFHFLLNEMIKHRTKLSGDLILKQSSIINIKIKDKVNYCNSLVVHDLCKILMSSLDNMCKEFKCKTSKGYFPHNLITNADQPFQEFISVLPEHFTPDHIGKVWKDLEKEIKNYRERGDSESDAKKKAWNDKFQKWPIREQLEKYGSDDVDCLVELYDQVDKLCYAVLHTSVLSFPTAANMAFYGGIQNIPKKFLYEKTQNNIKTRIYTCTKNEERLCRSAIYGGNTKPRYTQWKSDEYRTEECRTSYRDIKDYYVYFDVKSMYVTIMRNMEFPFNQQKELQPSKIKQFEQYLQSDNPEDWDKIGYCILLVDAELHPYEVEPPVPRKKGTRLIKVIKDGVEELEQAEGKKNETVWDNTLRRAAYTHIDLKLILKNGGKIHKVHEGLYWNEHGQLFKKWMDITIRGKSQAEKDGNSGLYAFYKLLGNATYGALCRRECDTCAAIVKSLVQKDKFHANFKWTGIRELDNGTFMFTGEKIEKYSDHYRTTRACYLGAMILSYSRQLFDKIYDCVNPYRRDKDHPEHLTAQSLYGDTDSLMVHASALPRLRAAGLIGEQPGQLGDEIYKKFNIRPKCAHKEAVKITNPNHYRHAKIIEYTGPAPKVYSGKYILPPECSSSQDEPCVYDNDNDHVDVVVNTMKIKAKGIPLKKDSLKILENGQVTNKKFDYETLSNAVRNGESIEFQYRTLKRKGKNETKNEAFHRDEIFTIGAPDLTRSLFKKEWRGRKKIKIEDNGNTITVPIDYGGEYPKD